MNEKPILFLGSMVTAILAGRKDVTRRFFRQAHDIGGHPADAVCQAADGSWIPWWGPTDPEALAEFTRRQYPFGGFRCPYDAPRLWVRETWALIDLATNFEWRGKPPPACAPMRPRVVYRADAAGPVTEPVSRWRSSIHMPRWASRLTLEVVSVRPERLQAITEEDARREGVGPANSGVAEDGGPLKTYRTGFVYAWRGINGKRAPWESNPWVWRIEFRRVER